MDGKIVDVIILSIPQTISQMGKKKRNKSMKTSAVKLRNSFKKKKFAVMYYLTLIYYIY